MNLAYLANTVPTTLNQQKFRFMIINGNVMIFKKLGRLRASCIGYTNWRGCWLYNIFIKSKNTRCIFIKCTESTYSVTYVISFRANITLIISLNSCAFIWVILLCNLKLIITVLIKNSLKQIPIQKFYKKIIRKAICIGVFLFSLFFEASFCPL